MSETNKTYRLRTNVDGNAVNASVNVQLSQDFDILEVLSLKISREQIYKMHTAKYGCIAGRVLANGNFGIPNAKISVFIEADEDDLLDPIFSALYPYSRTSDTNLDNKRYNLLPEEKLSDCHQPVGSFPSKRMVLDDANVIEIFDKYYKYTTTSNASGDYMIFGVPTGNQRIHVDIDLSDIGMLSQKPRDLYYKGYNKSLFENASMFKNDTNLDNLAQIITKNETVYVYPFWGEENEGDDIAISRRDIKIDYKFEPTCIFMGSLVTDSQSNGFSKKCIPTERMGKMDTLTTGEGTIEMIRKKTDGTVEEYHIQGNQLIDGNGTWCYQIPMNLDYMATDEYGNMVPTDNPEMGIPTRTRVRFRISLNDFDSDYANNHLTKMLVPNNPQDKEHLDYVFGTNTMDEEDGSGSFRDLFWNNVYTVKSYIPRIQKGNYNRNRRFSGVKQVNVDGGRNPIPYNNIRINLSFQFTIQCAILKLLVRFTSVLNKFIKLIPDASSTKEMKKFCMTLGDGICPDLEDWYFSPGCHNDYMRRTLTRIQETEVDSHSIDSQNNENSNSSNICLTNKIDYLMQCIEINLAKEYEVIQFDFYNDWINGMLYIPKWFATLKKKKSYFWGLWQRPERIQACTEEGFSKTRRYTQQCALSYGPVNGGNGINVYTDVRTKKGCSSNDKYQKCHKGNGRLYGNVFGKNGGGVHIETTLKGQNVYYFKPCEWDKNNKKINFFASDIILIGNINPYNQDGIPQAFKSLQSSSFKMPTNLAATNMNSEGYMYGNGTNGTLCSKANIVSDGLVQKPDTANSYDIWTKHSNDLQNDNVKDDKTEYIITESSGIDWGYVGPNQDVTKSANKLSSLYFPGGHFLGISCTESNTQVNIKSCVNLSRICEIGVTFSQRKNLPYVYNNEMYYAHLIPTGLIDGDSISDENFRSMFATLNINHLKTKYNPQLQRREYDFKYCHPVQFDGALSQVIGSNAYNRSNGFNDDTENVGDPVTAFIRSYEVVDTEYYRYRLGLTKLQNNDIKKKYIIDNGNEVALPVYENSYYFYFGLKDGATALDRFITEYYAECPISDNYEPTINVVSQNATFCNGNDGKLMVKVPNLLTPITITVENSRGKIYPLKPKENSNNGYVYDDANGEETILTEYPSVEIDGLSEDSYKITAMDSKGTMFTTSASIGVVLPDAVNNLVYNIPDKFEHEVYFEYDDGHLVGDFKEAGSQFSIENIDANIISIIVSNDAYYHYYYTNGSDDISALNDIINGKEEINDFYGGENGVHYLWQGNDSYAIHLRYKCPDTGKVYTILGYSFFVGMDGSPDYFIGNTDVNGRRLKQIGVDTTNDGWYNNSNALKNLKPYEMWALKKGLLATGSVYAHDTESIIVGLINADVDDKMIIYGHGETDNGDYVSMSPTQGTEDDMIKNGYSLNIDGFVIPTQSISDGTEYEFDLESYGISSGIKKDYNMTFNGMDISGNGTNVGGYGSNDGNNGDNTNINPTHTISFTLTNCKTIDGTIGGSGTHKYVRTYNHGEAVVIELITSPSVCEIQKATLDGERLLYTTNSVTIRTLVNKDMECIIIAKKPSTEIELPSFDIYD